MKKYLILLMFLLMVGCSTNEISEVTPKQTVSQELPDYYVQEPVGETMISTVIEVVDGDTVKVKLPNGKVETVRLLLIDTPETVHPTKPVEPFGPEASAFAKEFFKKGDTVEVDIDVSERDKYGRLLAYLWKDGVLYQNAILEQGLARIAYVYEPNTSYIDLLKATQEVAQEKGVGIWSVEDYKAEERGKDKVTTNDQSSTSIADANGDGKCNDIKGNEGSNGNIYHLPGGSYYEKTKAEQYFCTEQEAEAAGFRKSGR